MFTRLDIAGAPVLTRDEVIEDPQVKHNRVNWNMEHPQGIDTKESLDFYWIKICTFYKHIQCMFTGFKTKSLQSITETNGITKSMDHSRNELN